MGGCVGNPGSWMPNSRLMRSMREFPLGNSPCECQRDCKTALRHRRDIEAARLYYNVHDGAADLVMSYEMVVRRILNAPTLWAFDVSYMLSGMIFVMATGFTLLRNEHIRIDFLSTRCRSPRNTPRISFSTYAICARALYPELAADARYLGSFMTGRVERVSPWSPVIWPYYLGLTFGLWRCCCSRSPKSFATP